MMKNSTPVTAILSEKGNHVYQTSPDSSVADAVHLMNQHHIGSLVVSNQGEVVGIFTERDVLVRVVAEGRDPKLTPVKNVMTADLKRITPGTTIAQTMSLMTEKRARHLPVIDNGELVGMISIGDVTRYLMKLNESEIENMKDYVFGSYPG